MKTNKRKTFLALLTGVWLAGATLLLLPLPQTASAVAPVKGQDKAGKNCERKDTPGSSTFGKCENVCKDKEVTRDALNNRWVCQAYKSTGKAQLEQAPNSGGVLDAGPKPKPPLTAGAKTGKAKKN